MEPRFLDRALELAERGRGTTHPNPIVGAVVVSDGDVGDRDQSREKTAELPHRLETHLAGGEEVENGGRYRLRFAEPM